MKKIIILIAAIISTQAFACPDLSGSYLDKNNESVILTQKGCDEVSILSKPLTHSLLLNNEFTLVQEDQDLQAFGRGTFQDLEMVLEVKIIYKRDMGIPKILLPVKGINKYSHTANGDLLEKSTIYNTYNGVLSNTKTVYKKNTSW